jgi:hypothetical protein
MRLLESNSAGQLSLTKDLIGDDIPKYAILSHTWGVDTEEITFKDMMDGTGEDKLGYKKIWFCGEQARRDGLQYFWVDTCCIDKSSSAELQEAITSMFCWYQNADRCYVYLSDISSPTFDTNDELSELPWESAFRKSRWFTRGWTLQELLAPRSVEFFSREGYRLGDKRSLEQHICEITRITVQPFKEPLSLISALMSDCHGHKTARPHAKRTRRTRYWVYSMSTCRSSTAKGEIMRSDGFWMRSTSLYEVRR